MTHKVTIMISAMALLWGSIAWPQKAGATETGNLKYDEEHLYIPTRIAPNEDNIDGVFNQYYNPDVKLHLGTLITYDETKYSQTYVEAHLAEYAMNGGADWVKGALTFSAPVDFGEIVVVSSVANEQFLKGYRPGVAYYLIETSWRDDPAETWWYWGEIDYRQCAAVAKDESFDLSGVCLGQVNDAGEYVLRRVGAGVDPGENYVSWAEELQETLKNQLEDAAKAVEEWSGDQDERKNLLELLQIMQRRAEDAQEAEVLQIEINELIVKLGDEEDNGSEGDGSDNKDEGLGEGGGNLGGGNENPDEADKKPVIPVEPTPGEGGNTQPNRPSTNRPSSNLGQSSSSVPGQVNTGQATNNTTNAERKPENGRNNSENGSVLGNLVAVNDANADKNDQRSVLEADGMDENAENRETERNDRVEVPTLNEGNMSIPYKRWLVLPAIGSIILALIALGAWIWRRYRHTRA